ncbi:MAG TPA: single-stranded DNA-binding protein [Sedimentibacter sp.]|nr:single-stranded DNA-binding protein [Sedimentibacter sp.]
MNKWCGTGRFVRDAEIRYSQGDKPCCFAKFTIAVNRRFKRDDEPDADFIQCTAFGKTAEVVEKYFSKGMKIEVTGEIRTGSYTNKDGIKVYTTEISVENVEFAESKQSGSGGGGNSRTTDNSFMDIPGDDLEELPFS